MELKAASNQEAKITKDEAVQNAYDQFGITFSVKDKKIGKAKHCLITDGKGNKDRSIYLVTFKGANAGAKQHHDELNVVVDADTGEVLYGFSYR